MTQNKNGLTCIFL